jgi:hypothetical protein
MLSAIFILMSLDETAHIHEAIGEKLHLALNTGGFLLFAWVIPAAIFVALLALVYRRFLLNLPRKTRLLFVVSGAMYVGGAIGMELLEGKYLGTSVTMPVVWIIITTIEETLEISGLIVFLHTLMSYSMIEGRSELELRTAPERETAKCASRK